MLQNDIKRARDCCSEIHDVLRSVPRPDVRRDTSFLDHEKVVWEWPDVSTRVIEDVR